MGRHLVNMSKHFHDHRSSFMTTMIDVIPLVLVAMEFILMGVGRGAAHQPSSGSMALEAAMQAQETNEKRDIDIWSSLFVGGLRQSW